MTYDIEEQTNKYHFHSASIILVYKSLLQKNAKLTVLKYSCLNRAIPRQFQARYLKPGGQLQGDHPHGESFPQTLHGRLKKFISKTRISHKIHRSKVSRRRQEKFMTKTFTHHFCQLWMKGCKVFFSQNLFNDSLLVVCERTQRIRI